MSNILTIFFAVVLFTAVACVVVASTQAEGAFPVSEEQQQVMDTYDEMCPFTAIERADLISSDSVRKYVEFVDVYCDEVNGEEKVVVKLLGSDKENSRREFTRWVADQNIQNVQVHIQE